MTTQGNIYNIPEERYLSPRQYGMLLYLYYEMNDENHYFLVSKFDAEQQKLIGNLVNKNYANYSDNTNKVRLSLIGINSVSSPMGLDIKERDKILKEQYNAWRVRNGEKPDWGIKKARHIEPGDVSPGKRSSNRPGYTPVPKDKLRLPDGVKKIDIVEKYYDKGQTPQQIFESMAKEGVTTTVGSVKCFIKTINEKRAAAKQSKTKKK